MKHYEGFVYIFIVGTPSHNVDLKGKSDKQCVYIPLVFFNKKTSRKSMRMGLQVCLVENHHKLIKVCAKVKTLNL